MSTKFPHKANAFTIEKGITIDGMEVMFDQTVEMVSTEVISSQKSIKSSNRAAFSMTIRDNGADGYNAKGFYDDSSGIYTINFDYSDDEKQEVKQRLKNSDKWYFKDTVWGIANRFNLNLETFAKANGSPNMEDFHLTGKSHVLIDPSAPLADIANRWQKFMQRNGWKNIAQKAQSQLGQKLINQLVAEMSLNQMIEVFDEIAEDVIKSRILSIEKKIRENQSIDNERFFQIASWARYYKAMRDSYLPVGGMLPLKSQSMMVHVDDPKELERWIAQSKDQSRVEAPDFTSYYTIDEYDVFNLRKKQAAYRGKAFNDTYHNYLMVKQYLVFFPFQYMVFEVHFDGIGEEEVMRSGINTTLPQREQEYNRIYLEEGAFMANGFKFGIGLFETTPLSKLSYAINGQTIFDDEQLSNWQRAGYVGLFVLDLAVVGASGTVKAEEVVGSQTVKGIAGLSGVISNLGKTASTTFLPGAWGPTLGCILVIGSKGFAIANTTNRAVWFCQTAGITAATILLGHKIWKELDDE